MELKTCSKCQTLKPICNFHKNKARSDGLSHYCVVCANARAAQKRLTDPEKVKEIQAKWRIENREKAKAACTKWRINNRDKARVCTSIWKKENPVKSRALTNARKRRARLSTPLWADLKKVKKLYQVAATWNEIWPEDPVHVDHIIPLKGKNVSGLHTELNLQILRAADNMKKSNKLLDISST